MHPLESIRNKAKSALQNIVLPETEDARTLEAAVKATEEGLAKIQLIGSGEAIACAAKDKGLSMDGIDVVDHRQSEYRDEYVQEYFQLRRHKGVSLEEAIVHLVGEDTGGR